MIQGVRDLAYDGDYDSARKISEKVVRWLKNNSLHDSEKYNLLSEFRNGCSFALNLKEVGVILIRCCQKSEHAQWFLSFIRHILLDSGRIEAENCEIDLAKIGEILRILGERDFVELSQWPEIFDCYADLLKHQEQDRVRSKPGSAMRATLQSSRPEESDSDSGQLFQLYPAFQSSLDMITQIADKHDQEKKLKELVMDVKRSCAQLGYGRDVLLEAGAVMRELCRSEAGQVTFFQRILHDAVKNFGLASFGPGKAKQTKSSYLSAMSVALCKWGLPPEHIRPVLKKVVDIFDSRLEGKAGWNEDNERFKISVREMFANIYCQVLHKKQGEISGLMEEERYKKAKEEISRLLMHEVFCPGELNALKLQKARCYRFIKGEKHSAFPFLKGVRNSGLFGMRKAELFVELGEDKGALSVIDDVKRKGLSVKEDIDHFFSQQVHKIESGIHQSLIKKGVISEKLYPNMADMRATLDDSGHHLLQLKSEMARLNRRLQAKHLNEEAEQQEKKDLELRVTQQDRDLEELKKKLAASESRVDALSRSNEKLETQNTNLKTQLHASELWSQAASSKKGSQKGSLTHTPEFLKLKIKQYQRERNEGREETAKKESIIEEKSREIGALEKEAADLKDGVKRLQKKLNPELVVRHSEIAGKGLFASHDIPLGAKLGEYTGEKVYRQKIPLTGLYAHWRMKPSGEPEYLKKDVHTVWISDPKRRKLQPEEGVDAEQVALPDDKKSILRFMNHSEDFNSQLVITPEKRIFAVAIREIKEGEELLWNYDTGRTELYNLSELCEGEKRSVLEQQDHIEPYPEKHMKVNSKTGKVMLKAQSRRKGNYDDPYWS